MASESGTGQTIDSNIYGVRTDISTLRVSRNRWEAVPEKVRVLYAKTQDDDLYPEYLWTRGIRREYGGPILQA